MLARSEAAVRRCEAGGKHVCNEARGATREVASLCIHGEQKKGSCTHATNKRLCHL